MVLGIDPKALGILSQSAPVNHTQEYMCICVLICLIWAHTCGICTLVWGHVCGVGLCELTYVYML